MPRRPGSLVRATCCLCGTVELARGAGNFSLCQQCKAKGLHGHKSRRATYDVTGKENAGAEVARAVRDGRLKPASSCLCADCASPAVDYDHRDYNKPLDVQPVCRGCNLRRGPAKPKAGWLEAAMRHGVAPYRLRCRAAQAIALAGLSPVVLEGMPARLSMDHWRRIASTAAPAEPAEQGA